MPKHKSASIVPEDLVFKYKLLGLSADEWDEFRIRMEKYSRQLLARGDTATGILTCAIEERSSAILWQTKAYSAGHFTKDFIDANLTDAERSRFRHMVDEFCARLEESAIGCKMVIDNKSIGLTVKQMSDVNYLCQEYKAAIVFAMREAALKEATPRMLDEILAARHRNEIIADRHRRASA